MQDKKEVTSEILYNDNEQWIPIMSICHPMANISSTLKAENGYCEIDLYKKRFSI